MSNLQQPSIVRPILAIAFLVAIDWGTWVHHATKPTQLVNRSAFRNYKVAVATTTPEKAPAPKHNKTTGAYVVWKDLTEAEKSILKPLERRWDYLSASQRQTLMATAERYPCMPDEQKARFDARLVEWTLLTGKERREMRERYKALLSLPPQEQEHLKQAWRAEHEAPHQTMPTS